ncbi:hypothetical protein DPMN_100181 [Dreissena polymorpha]|uniref:Uncharacterized protein n=1 Tax=Dreissena polymorpha TaxID=45954 RepID=A0A9D4LGD9_DREPO|nr:hypothetical protein DPMN_100181 [Dreissena polymorpha]
MMQLPEHHAVCMKRSAQQLRLHATVYLCTLCPRTDTNIGSVNEEIQKLCMDNGAVLIDCYHSFIYANNTTIRPFYFKDSIRLCQKCLSRLVSTINAVTPIVKFKHTSARQSTHRAATRYSWPPWTGATYGIRGRFQNNGRQFGNRNFQLRGRWPP